MPQRPQVHSPRDRGTSRRGLRPDSGAGAGRFHALDGGGALFFGARLVALGGGGAATGTGSGRSASGAFGVSSRPSSEESSSELVSRKPRFFFFFFFFTGFPAVVDMELRGAGAGAGASRVIVGRRSLLKL